ncbi:MAG: RNA polymerase sigma factor [Actinomycetota bacterium]
MLPPFQRLLDEHGAALHRFCVAQAGPDHGPDCFQEAVLAALRAYPDLRDATNLRSWLFTIAHRKVIDHHRRRQRVEPVADVAAAGGADRAGSSGPISVEQAAADGQVWGAVALLPDKQRGAIALRYLADLPYADIAAALDCTEAAARQNVRAGLARLRSEVTP